MKRLIWSLILLALILPPLSAQSELQIGLLALDGAQELTKSLHTVLTDTLHIASFEDYTEYQVAYHPLYISEHLHPFLLKEDVIIGDYLCRVHELNYLLIVTRSTLDTFQRITLQLFDGQQLQYHMLYDRLESEVVLEELLLASASYFRVEEQALAILEVNANNYRVTLDYEEQPYQRYLLLDTQRHILSVEGEDYLPKYIEFQLDNREIRLLTVEMEQVAPTTTLLYSQHGSAVALLDGLELVELPYLWTHVPSQRAIIVEKPQFASSKEFVNSSAPLMAIRSKPSYLHEPTLLLEARDATYRALGRTILLFGATLVINNLPFLQPDQTNLYAYQPLKFITQGALYISLGESLWRLFDYYRKTEYSAL